MALDVIDVVRDDRLDHLDYFFGSITDGVFVSGGKTVKPGAREGSAR
jgi:hypothetical protein